MEELLIKKIKGGIVGIKSGSKEPKDVASLLNLLKKQNQPMYEELLDSYKDALEKRK
jgi:hypothetical protein